MKHEVQIETKKTDTIHIDDVDKSCGILLQGSNKRVNHWVVKKGFEYGVINYLGDFNSPFSSLEELIKNSSGYDFIYLPTGQRIVLDKTITINDLKNSDNVGFVDNEGRKGYVSSYRTDGDYEEQYMGLVMPTHEGTGFAYSLGTGLHRSLKEVICRHNANRVKITEVYKFDTRKELYQWLAE